MALYVEAELLGIYLRLFTFYLSSMRTIKQYRNQQSFSFCNRIKFIKKIILYSLCDFCAFSEPFVEKLYFI